MSVIAAESRGDEACTGGYMHMQAQPSYIYIDTNFPWDIIDPSTSKNSKSGAYVATRGSSPPTNYQQMFQLLEGQQATTNINC